MSLLLQCNVCLQYVPGREKMHLTLIDEHTREYSPSSHHIEVDDVIICEGSDTPVGCTQRVRWYRLADGTEVLGAPMNLFINPYFASIECVRFAGGPGDRVVLRDGSVYPSAKAY